MSEPRKPSPVLWGVLGAVVAGVLAVAASVLGGFSGDEEALHYLVARQAPAQPELFLHSGSRPGVTLALALPAQAGLWAARLTAALATGLCAWGVARLARVSGVHASWAWLLLFLQPFYLAHCGRAMTEPLAAALLVWGAVAVMERRTLLLVVMAALLPLVRLELVVLWPAVGWILIRWRRTVGLVLVPVPLLVWLGAGAWTAGDWAWIQHQLAVAPYPRREWGHYLRSLGWIVGWAALAPLMVGWFTAWGRRPPAGWRLSASMVAVLWVLYEVLAAGRGGTGGNLRYLAMAAPFVAVVGAAGLGQVAAVADRRPGFWLGLIAAVAGSALVWNRLLFDDLSVTHQWDWVPLILCGVWLLVAAVPRLRPAALLVAVILGVVAFPVRYAQTLRLHPTGEEQAVTELAASVSHAQPVWVAHTRFPMAWDVNPYDADRIVPDPDAASVLVWDSHYAPARGMSMHVDSLAANPVWRFAGGVVATDTSFAAAWFDRSSSAPAGDREVWLRAARRAQARVIPQRRLAQFDPRNAELWRELALRAQAAQDWVTATTARTRARVLEPHHPDLAMLEAVALEAWDRTDEALGILLVAAQAHPDHGPVQLAAGKALLRGNQDGAQPYLAHAANLMPADWEANYLAGRLAEREQRWQEAVHYLERAAAARPEHAGTQTRLREARSRLVP